MKIQQRRDDAAVLEGALTVKEIPNAGAQCELGDRRRELLNTLFEELGTMRESGELALFVLSLERAKDAEYAESAKEDRNQEDGNVEGEETSEYPRELGVEAAPFLLSALSHLPTVYTPNCSYVCEFRSTERVGV